MHGQQDYTEMHGQQNYTEMHGQQDYTEMHGQQDYTEMHGQQDYTEMHGQQDMKTRRSVFTGRYELKTYVLQVVFSVLCGPGSSVGMATGYGLDGPVIESRWGLHLPHLSRTALGSTQLPVQWVPGLSWG